MSAQNYTFRLTDEILKWLERNGQPKSKQLRRDLEALQMIRKLAKRDKQKHLLLRDVAEDFGLLDA